VRNTLDLSARSAAQRVGAFLLRLADLQSNGSPPILPIAKRHLAARLGITPETFSRMLQTVADHGLYLRGRTIIIRDRQKIEQFCGPDPYIARDEHELGVFAI
jgi:CRP-like cAMP-binding protein